MPTTTLDSTKYFPDLNKQQMDAVIAGLASQVVTNPDAKVWDQLEIIVHAYNKYVRGISDLTDDELETAASAFTCEYGDSPLSVPSSIVGG